MRKANRTTVFSYLTFVLMLFSLAMGCAFAEAEETMPIRIEVNNLTAIAGSTVDVDVIIANNPGILGATLSLRYADGLTLLDAKPGNAFTSLKLTNPGDFSSPCKFMWDGQEILAENIKDGTILTLIFQVSDNVQDGQELAIEIFTEEGSIVNGDLVPLSVQTVGGKITLSGNPDDVDIISSTFGAIDGNEVDITVHSVKVCQDTFLVLAGFSDSGAMRYCDIQHPMLTVGENTFTFQNVASTLTYKAFLTDQELRPYCPAILIQEPEPLAELENVSLSAVDDTPTLLIDSVVASPGDQVTVNVRIMNNPGVLGATFIFSYDEKLTLKEAVAGDAFRSLFMSKSGNLSSPCKFTWDGQDISTEDITDGIILTLTFEVAPNAAISSALFVKASYDAGSVVDTNLNPVQLVLADGVVTVQDFLYGDLNGDQLVNATDVILMRRNIVGGYSISVNESAADVNTDEVINTTDVILLRRFIVGGYGIVFPYRNTPNPKPTPVPDSKTHGVAYDIANGDAYLQGLLDAGKIANPNPENYVSGNGVTLRDLRVDGYKFLGWYDGAGSNAALVKKIASSEADDVELYAHWEKISYTVQYKSDLFLDRASETYTVDTGLVLPTPKLSNYVFTGWSDENGNLYKGTKIPAGTTGSITLEANWTSLRNRTWTNPNPKNPVIMEDEEKKVILFAYEIGAIENIPVAVIHNFGHIEEDGVSKTEEATYSETTQEELMRSYTKTVANATTESSDWTLSKEWNESVSLNEQSAKERGFTKEEAESLAKSNENNWNVSSGCSGTTETMRLTTGESGWENTAKIGLTNETETGTRTKTNQAFNIGANISYTPKSYSLGLGNDKAKVEAGTSGGWGGGLNAGYSNGREKEEWNTSKDGLSVEFGGSFHQSNLTTDSTVSSSSWNSGSSYGGSESIASNSSIATALSEKICETTGYGKSYLQGENISQTMGLASTRSASDGYTNSVAFSKITQTEKTQTWTTNGTKAGWHRWVYVNKAHIFAVVVYSMESKSYSVYTYSIMDDAPPQPFEDYSYISGDYNDHENGVISFEIPYEVAEYVSERTSFSDGLEVDPQTGMVTNYSGSDNCVVIPEYYHVGNKVVKITGISKAAFQNENKEQLVAVVLSDFITEIPDGTFAGCTSLESVYGKGITKIGNNAFDGCTSIVDCAVTPQVTSLGANAFKGVNGLLVTPSNANVAEAAAKSGAEMIAVYCNHLNEGTLNHKTFDVPEGTDYFEIYGDNQSYSDLTINSKAAKTTLNQAHFIATGRIPLQISSPDLILNEISVTSSGFSMVLLSENTRLGLQDTISLKSDSGNALLCKNLNLYKSNERVIGKLAVSKKILVCGAVEGDNLLTYDEYAKIDADTFERLLHSYTLYFDANGGTCDTLSREVPNGIAIGELPVATKNAYSLSGWYQTDGTPVTAETVFSDGLDHTLYAQWAANSYTIFFDGNGGNVSVGSKVVAFGTQYGSLPSATRDGYSLVGWHTGDGSTVTESTILVNPVDHTLYAQWTANSYTISFDGNGGSVGFGSKAVTYSTQYGSLPSATRDGYSLVGWHTGDGSTVTESTILVNPVDHTLYAQWTANSYTVSFDGNGGNVGFGSKIVTYGTQYGSLPSASRDGYTFSGWYKNDGSKIDDSTVMWIASDHTLFAHWDRIYVQVPDFTNWTADDARAWCNQNGLSYTEDWAYDWTKSWNQVRSNSHCAWSVEYGTNITLYISKGEKPIEVGDAVWFDGGDVYGYIGGSGIWKAGSEMNDYFYITNVNYSSRGYYGFRFSSSSYQYGWVPASLIHQRTN